MTTQIITHAGNDPADGTTVFTVPANVTRLTVECRGTGGVGLDWGGSGGGAYSSKYFGVYSGETYEAIFSQPAPASITTYNKNAVFRKQSGDIICLAAFGGSGWDGSGGQGGQAANCIGDVRFSGGNGGTAAGYVGGGGGGGAGNSGNGGDGTSAVGSVPGNGGPGGISGGGAGGKGCINQGLGDNGIAPGGGAGGSYIWTSYSGGGSITISWQPDTNTVIMNSSA